MILKPSTLPTILSDVLTACQNAYGQTGAPEIPARTFVAHGQPVVQPGVDQLTVQSLGISAVHPFPLAQLRALRTTVVPSAGISIEIWRSCWPSPDATSHASKNAVSPQQFTAASSALALDLTTVWGWLADLAVHDGLVASFPTIAGAADISMSPAIPLGPQGTMAGWKILLAAKMSVTGQ